MSQDPIGYTAGVNLYCTNINNTVTRLDPSGLFDVKVKSVGDGPQAKKPLGEAYFYWGVALYPDNDMLKKLKECKGGFVVIHRRIIEGGGNLNGEIKIWHKRDEWFRSDIAFVGKDIDAYDPDNGIKYKGGPIKMADGAIALDYISVMNNAVVGSDNAVFGFRQVSGSVVVNVTWSIYANCESKITHWSAGDFTKLRETEPGPDERTHKKWSDEKPQIEGKPLATGTIDGRIEWNGPDLKFSSFSTDIVPGPQRIGRKPQLPPWKYDSTKGWQLEK
jgi:hypothetical protein